MTKIRQQMSAILPAALASAALVMAAAPASAQGSDRMPGGVEHKPGMEEMGASRGLRARTVPPPAPVQALPTPAPAPAANAPAAKPPQADDEPAKKKKKKSSKRSIGSQDEAPAAERSMIPGGGDDKRVGGVERSPETRGSQP